MDDSVCIRFEVIRDECLQGWRSIGTGGFGQIYRAKHKTLGMDVAIKLLHYKDGPASSIQREALLMFQGGNPNVIRILGLYEGRVGEGRGLVMEFMPKGSVADLLQTLAGPPPWPLTFRMTHQISLGMNFLHHLTPPLLHLDLKPSNVLLDDSLRAKLTDFGLSRVARSVSRCSREKDEDDGGTLSYMPPEALQSVNYKASKATDVYSYGVLLWSIVTGKEPYEDALSSLVRFRIPQGDRPDLSSIDPRRVKGLEDMVKLMTECWHQDPSRRPSFLDCVHATEKISNMHKHGLNDAVYDVLKQLDDDICSGLKSIQISRQPHNGSMLKYTEIPLILHPTSTRGKKIKSCPTVLFMEVQRVINKVFILAHRINISRIFDVLILFMFQKHSLRLRPASLDHFPNRKQLPVTQNP
ncbi:receptor-interacting serine/threonine-protein kinase 3-like isoform X2 [Sinocyclocheilus grahami]|uniref:receptor-interacting serine/threonine-protein kinase 3-like isoform X2 n=1 Tax=Sinocyclocheilus grahami TaxID=75366 RepID=UPI0007AC7BB0|nr:PREDICTED: receptor-interacting serine/threonine-protein kinase 3-like isoform X2 [Sinocyclocheilus grahami]